MSKDEYRPQQRAALVAWWLAHGEGLRTRDVARLTGLSRQGALDLMNCLSEVLPWYQDDNFVWQELTGEPEGGNETGTHTCDMVCV